MYSHRDKILKKPEEKHTEIEDEVTNALFEYENSAPKEVADTVKAIKILKAQKIDINQTSQVLLITVPYTLLGQVRKVQAALVGHMEGKFKCPVIIVGYRTIVSKYQKRKGSQRIPISRTLTAVHEAYLNDVIYPFEAIGKRIRVKTDGTRVFKLHFKEEDKKLAEDRCAAMAAVYKQLTNKIISFEFVKAQLEERRKKKKKEQKREPRKGKREPRKDRKEKAAPEAPKEEKVAA